MIYKEFHDLKLSALGMGTMRLPLIDGRDEQVDEEKAAEIIDAALKGGINYFDTAWGYHGGNSELVMGRILEKYPRESFYLATKFPGYDLANMSKAEEIFEKQLEKCRVEYFDFYLFHNVCEMNIDAYLDKKYGIDEYLVKQRENGRIRHLGFSAHGSYDVMKHFLESYGSHMEFCQLQINYIDWNFQDAKRKVELLKEYGIPVWVMEPLRGGKLASLSDADEKVLKELRPKEKIPAWAFRFQQSLPEVKMILSGMSSLEQLKENMKTFEDEKPLSDAEMKKLLDIADHMINGVPCTACHYCTSHCPSGIDIPAMLKLYNEHVFTGGGFLAPMTIQSLPEEKRPSACAGCRSCEAVCPQQIKISEVLADFVEKLKS
ncbi:MAG: oxidoreductase [Dorea sp.]|nr:oxidoreductase [Dorea sp.]